MVKYGCQTEVISLPTKGGTMRLQGKVAIITGAAGVAYTAAKHALVGLTRNTAWMYAGRGVRCNASLALFLASDESRHINGAIIPADAGWAAV
jgi:hypothetical protein